MVPIERSLLQQATRRVHNAVEKSLKLSQTPSVISELSNSINYVASRLKTNELAPHLIVGGRSAPLAKALLDICMLNAGMQNLNILTLESSENKKLYEGESYRSGEDNRDYIIPDRILNFPKKDSVYYVDDRVRTGEKAFHVRKALKMFGYEQTRFLTFASALYHPDVVTGTRNPDVYALIDNLSYLFSRKALLLTEGKIVHEGNYYNVQPENIPPILSDDLNKAESILSIIQGSLGIKK